MALELVTGYRGRLHITAPQDADLYRGLIGDCIVKVGSQMAVEITSPTEVTISDGVCLFDGREFFIEYGDSVSAVSAVEDGEAYLCVCYERDELNLYENADFEILESYDDRDIRERPDNSQKPFARLTVENGEITSVEVLPAVVDPIAETSKAVAEMLAKSEEAIERMESDVANLEELIAQTEQAISDAQAATANAVDCADQASEAAEKAETIAESLEEYEGRFASDEGKIADLDRRVTALEEGTVADKIFAVYCADDGSLTFYADSEYPDGSTYKGKTVTELYESIENDSSGYRPWNSIRDDIKSAAFDESFASIQMTNLSGMFQYCQNMTKIDLTYLDTSAVTNTGAMFYRCSSLTSLDVSKFDTSAMTNMNSMFFYCSSLTSLDVSKFDTSAMKTMNSIFYGCSGLTELDVSEWNTANVTNMSYMFNNCSGLTTIYSDDSNFVTTAVTSDDNMFDGCTSLVGGNGTKYDSSKVDSSMAHVDTSSNPGYFTAK